MRQPEIVALPGAQHRAGIAADARPGVTQGRLDVLLAHHVIDRHHPPRALRHQVERGIGGLLALFPRDPGERAAHVLRVGWIARVCQHDTVPPAGRLDDVPPARRAGGLLALEPCTRRRIGEPRAEGIGSALECPTRNGGLESGATRGVDVHIRRDIHTARPRALHGLPHRVHQDSPPRLVRDLQVEDLHRHPGALAHGDRLVHRLHHLPSLAPDVARVDAPMPRRRLADLHQLIGRRVTAGRVDQRRRQAHRATAHRGVDDGAHPFQLRGARCAR